ncbi:MAG TPA: VOC family protein [Burkholderiaceae bacterium]|nr:VOC family protein [Burkholderiaceae bacterium]
MRRRSRLDHISPAGLRRQAAAPLRSARWIADARRGPDRRQCPDDRRCGNGCAQRSIHLHLYVRDVRAAFDRAVAVGASVVQPPERKRPDDDLRGGVQDAWGTIWWLGTQEAAGLTRDAASPAAPRGAAR